jgi:O-antigen/teichoic acid export membrane protein
MKPTPDIVDESAEVAAEAELAAGAAATADGRPAAPGAPNDNSLRRKALGGAAWTFGGYGVQQIVRFAAQLVLTRLLARDAFGLVMFVFTVRDALQMFSDIGLGQSLIQSKRTDPAFIRTAWTMQVVRGFAIAGVVSLLAPLIVYIYGDPRLYWITPLAAATALIDGFASTAMYTHPRRMRVVGVSVLDLVSQVIGSATIVGYAYFVDASVVALLLGGIVMSIVRTIGSHWLNRDTPDWFQFDREAFKQIVNFGRWIMASSALMFLASNVDRLVLQPMLQRSEGVRAVVATQPVAEQPAAAAKLAFELFGVYGIAMAIAMIPLQTILRVGIRVVFPVFSNTVNAGGDLRRAFAKARRFVVTGGGFSAAMMLGAGPAIITFLYPKDYHDAGFYLSILGAIIWLQTLDAANQAALVATGNTKASAISNTIKLATLSAGLYFGFELGGIVGALVGMAIADLCKYLYSSAMNVRLGLPLVKTDLVATIYFAAVGLALHFGFAGTPADTRLRNFVEVSAAGVIALGAAGLLFLWLREKPPQPARA